MITLALDASTYTGTVAVTRDGRLVAHERIAMRGEQHERLMPAVAAALAHAGVKGSEVARIVCGGGPGSFTSLRIAASIAKGLATGWGRPLFAMSSLALIVAGTDAPLAEGRYLAVLDALRGESYVAAYAVDATGAIAELVPVRLASRDDVPEIAASLDATPIGPGQRLETGPDARGIVRLGGILAAASAVDLAAWEPDYGRKAEAQVKWEAAHGRPLPLG